MEPSVTGMNSAERYILPSDMLVVPEPIRMVFYLLGPVAGKMQGA